MNKNVANLKNIIMLNQEKELIEKDSIFFSDYSDMINHLKNLNKQNKNIFLYLYKNNKNVQQILYNSEEIIYLYNSDEINYDNSLKINNTIHEHFYLNLLITGNLNTIDYGYSLGFIKNLEKVVINLGNNNELSKIVISKFILDLIKNYVNLDEYNDKNDDEILNELRKEMNKIIDDNLYVFKQLNLNLNEDDIKNTKIDELYIIIIKALISSKKFDNYDYIKNIIINQLFLDKIYLNEIMKEELIKFLDNKSNYIKKYLIRKKEDFLKEKKINFYYILLKYIVKNPIYIYQIEILLETRKIILDLIKNDELLIYNDINNDNLKEKKNYILEALLDSKYYYQVKKNKDDLLKLEDKENEKEKEKSKKVVVNRGNNISNSYFTNKCSTNNRTNNEIENCPETKNINASLEEKEESKKVVVNRGNNINNLFGTTKCSTNNRTNNEINYEQSMKFVGANGDVDAIKILSKSIFTFHINENKCINIDEINYGDEEIKISKEQFEKIIVGNFKDKKIEKKAKKFYNFIKEFKERLKIEFKYNYKLRINLYFKKENIDNKIENLDLSCKYIFYDPINNREFSFLDKKLLKYGINSLTNGFEFMIDKINSEYYKDIKYKEFIDNTSKNISYNKKCIKTIISEGDKENKVNNNSKSNDNYEISNKIFMNDSTREQTCIMIPEMRKIADEENVLEIIKILDKDNKYNGFILELDDGYYLTCKNDNSLNIYQPYFNFVMNIKKFNEPIFNVYERISNNKKNNISEIIICLKSDIYLLAINLKELNYTTLKVHNFKDYNFLNCVEIKESYYITLGFNGVFSYSNLFTDKNDISPKKICNEGYFNYIKINDNLLALVSNRIIPGGKDLISIYSNNSKKISYSYEGYSFILSPNGLTLFGKREIEFNENNDRKKKRKKKSKKIRINNILLCACKKYYNDQKNGILIINGDIYDYNNTYHKFFDTGSFEVNCFCPIKKVDNKNINFDNIDKEYKNNINITETDYFFVGGFDLVKRQGKIKLFKFILNEGIFDIKIDFLQDIEFLDNDDFNGFDSAINSIVQSNISGNIIIGCYDEKIYLFTQPNIDYYLGN